VIMDPEANEKDVKRILELVPNGEKHKWYRSMNSSQAVAQSVLGNLAAHDLLNYLSDLKCDDGLDLFGDMLLTTDNFTMEYKVDYLNEPRRTSLDGYLSGDCQIAIECKFTENEVGTCSRPRLKPSASNYESDHCDGTYSIQRDRKGRCSLSEARILYWHYIPILFKWKNNININPCPLYKNYQLVRNVLAAGVKPGGNVSPDNGHVVLIFDDRNPSFQNKGDGDISFENTRAELINPTMLRKCSWQRIVQHLRCNNILPWLTEELSNKYGF